MRRKKMNDHVPKRAKCLNCFRYLGDDRAILQGADGTWVHDTRLYDLKCNIWHNYVATPREDI